MAVGVRRRENIWECLPADDRSIERVLTACPACDVEQSYCIPRRRNASCACCDWVEQIVANPYIVHIYYQGRVAGVVLVVELFFVALAERPRSMSASPSNLPRKDGGGEFCRCLLCVNLGSRFLRARLDRSGARTYTHTFM